MLIQNLGGQRNSIMVSFEEESYSLKDVILSICYFSMKVILFKVTMALYCIELIQFGRTSLAGLRVWSFEYKNRLKQTIEYYRKRYCKYVEPVLESYSVRFNA